METSSAMAVMSALSQATRLDVFRTLVARLPEGMASGELASATGATANTMSAHLAILQRAGLVYSSKTGRVVTYWAIVQQARALSDFISELCDGPKLE